MGDEAKRQPPIIQPQHRTSLPLAAHLRHMIMSPMQIALTPFVSRFSNCEKWHARFHRWNFEVLRTFEVHQTEVRS